MLNTTKLLENKLFQERYIKPNIELVFFLPKRKTRNVKNL